MYARRLTGRTRTPRTRLAYGARLAPVFARSLRLNLGRIGDGITIRFFRYLVARSVPPGLLWNFALGLYARPPAAVRATYLPAAVRVMTRRLEFRNPVGVPTIFTLDTENFTHVPEECTPCRSEPWLRTPSRVRNECVANRVPRPS